MWSYGGELLETKYLKENVVTPFAGSFHLISTASCRRRVYPWPVTWAPRADFGAGIQVPARSIICLGVPHRVDHLGEKRTDSGIILHHMGAEGLHSVTSPRSAALVCPDFEAILRFWRSAAQIDRSIGNRRRRRRRCGSGITDFPARVGWLNTGRVPEAGSRRQGLRKGSSHVSAAMLGKVELRFEDDRAERDVE